MTKHRIQMVDHLVYFEAEEADDANRRTDGYYMTHATHKMLGGPNEITVTVEPGNTINIDEGVVVCEKPRAD